MLNEHLLMLLELAADEQPGEDSGAGEEGETGAEQTTEDSADGEGETEQTDAPPSEFEIDGERLTAEQIREYKKGYMRQSDYTKKTQAAAQEKRENAEAREVYDFLRANPEIAKRLAEEAPEQAAKAPTMMNPELQDINVKIQTMEIEKSIELLKMKDPEMDEIEVLQIANDLRVSVDSAYETWRGRNFDKILEQRLKKQSESITQKIKGNSEKTKSLITPKAKAVGLHGLSDAEVSFAAKMDMTPEEYAKWK